MLDVLQIHPRDNVVVALKNLPAEHRVGAVLLRDAVLAGHKIAIRPIAGGEAVIKFGHPVGRATEAIAAGANVHTHNLVSDLGDIPALPISPQFERGLSDGASRPATFDGFRRPDGRVGTRNEVWILNTVACVNRASEQIARATNARYCGYKTVDGVFAYPHPFGCSQLGDDLLYTQKILAGLVRHPNAGAVLILGLGCENNQIRSLLEQVGDLHPGRVKYFNAQDVADEIECGIDQAAELVEWACQFKREPVPIADLVVGLKCGGSDAFSGITANPLVGRVAERLCRGGSTALLSEVPEMFGAEAPLLAGCRSKPIADAASSMIGAFREYFRRYDQPVDENPSPGNKDGGITTLAEKSLACVQKAGHAPIVDVLPYGTTARTGMGGVALVNAPGNDGVSSTAMTAAGAQLLLFTTGRGTPLGMPVPTLKISSTTALYERKPSWIDFDAGRLLADQASPDELANELFELCLEVASGRRETRNEITGNREIAIWKDGVTL